MKNFDEFYERMDRVCNSLKEKEKLRENLSKILMGSDIPKFFNLMEKVRDSKNNREYYKNFNGVCSVSEAFRKGATLLTYFDIKAMHICYLQDKFKSGDTITWSGTDTMVIPCKLIKPKTPKEYNIDITITFDDFIDYILNYSDWEVE